MKTLILILLVLWLLVNIVTFILFGVDKRRARKERTRIAEKTLLLFALAFGSLGALLGMLAFHHKTLHKKFIFLVPLFLILQVALVVWIVMMVMRGN